MFRLGPGGGHGLGPVFNSARGAQKGEPRLRQLKPSFEHVNEMAALADMGTLLIFG